MKTENTSPNQHYVVAVNTKTNEVLAVSTKYDNKSELERLYGAWCIRMMLEPTKVLECLESVHFEIRENVKD
jgi:hypothetical protein